MNPELKIALASNWQFRAADEALSAAENFSVASGWQPASVPGTVYQDIIASGAIPDPCLGLNEEAVQWVADRDWCYRLDFELDPATLRAQTDLVFEGLDTFARVWLNDELILASNNMFVPARIPVGQHLRAGTNRLAIRFESALREGRAIEARHGKRHLWNGDASRLYVRKAQYHYGWDWGPVLLTAGPWKPVFLHSYDLRLAELDSRIWLAEDFGRARLDLDTRIEGDFDEAAARLEHELFDPEGRSIARIEAPLRRDNSLSLPIDAPQLWWPAGHGGQPLYRLVTTIREGGEILARQERSIGLRRLRLVQAPVSGEPGLSFHFEINGKAIFAGGANWIPDDNLLNRISPERYRERVKQAVEANMLMLRVWGGGIYEDDAFYEACDELGVLVWQDFLFACGLYPAHPEFLESVGREAEAALLRLRHHASLAIWCGNNEDYAIAESVNLSMECFEGRKIYEGLLPGLCAKLDPDRPYWPGSPYTPSATSPRPSDDPHLGDRHSWEVWHKEMRPYQHYHQVQARFVSEFGMQAHPSLALLERAIPEPERFPLSRTMTAHNKAGSAEFPDGHRRLAVYIADTLNAAPGLEGAVYASRFVQAEAMRYAYQDFRHRWQREGARAVGGALVWQLNDCWPATSWAIIDSAGTVKPAWHAIRRALASRSIALRLEAGRARGWLMSDRNETSRLTLRLRLHALDGTLLHEAQQALEAGANASTDFDFALPAQDRPCLARIEAFEAGRLVARDTAWPEPYRFHRLAPAGLSLVRDAARGAIRLQAQAPAKGIWLEAEGLEFADNFLDLLPGEDTLIPVQGDLSRPIRVFALDQDALDF